MAFSPTSLTDPGSRQIRNRAFEKLRESPHGESLSGFWNAH